MQDLERQHLQSPAEHNATPGQASRTKHGTPGTVQTGDRDDASAVASSETLSRTTSHGVDVTKAEQDFMDLQREFSRISQTSNRLARRESHANPDDLEKAISSTDVSSGVDESWDLEAALRGDKKAAEEASIRSKRVGVMWKDLTVSGIGGSRNIVQTFPDAFINFFNVAGTLMHLFGLGKKGKEFDILQDFNGVAKPGEMVLVLGRPGSGCTTFLKVIANQRYGYTKIAGDVRYGRFDADTFGKRYRGEAVYNEEDDIHHPSLTVGQTLGFALDAKMPAKRPGNLSKAAFREKVLDLLLKMFNIEHTRNTIVGNQYMRGVSGGERKRVSIAEMMVNGAAVCAWDNSTRGLDASTALDYAKSLRIITNIHKTTTFVSLYQASQNIYDLFDKVMVIDQGRQVFYGPTSVARDYFEGLGFLEKPRQTTPDYLTGCTDPFEREYKAGRGPENAPHSPETLVGSFKKSEWAKTLHAETEHYSEELEQDKEPHEDFQVAHREAKRKGTPKSSVYNIPFIIQVWILMKRQFLIKWQDKFSLVVSWATSILIAIIVGTVWLNLPRTSAGAFTRGGVLFVALLFNAFQAFGELASTMLGRPIVNKHRAYTFHRPGALWVAQILVDTAFATAQILVFSIIVYFMCGLVRDPGAFFTFVLLIISGYLMMTLFFRTAGCLCPDFDYAIKFAAVIITLLILTSGYLIQYQSQQVWLRWLFYGNAIGLGFSALMMNEFRRIDLTCTSDSLVPSGPGYSSIENQACTLAGSRPGSSIIDGSDYIKAAFTYDPKDQWRNFGILVVLVAFFLFTNATLGEAMKYGAGGRTITWFAKESPELRQLNKKLQDKKERRQLKEDGDDSGAELKIDSRSVMTWEDLNYDVPVPGGNRRLLNGVYGFVKPGLTALMGASGAGKTTLLDVLAARKNIGVISGDILIDGKKPGTSFQRGTAYAEQLDTHEPTATVREALRFSANLRQPYHVPQAEKYAYVEEVISLLEMENIADAIIGSPESGLSVEERKRVTIGVELAAKPEMLLFLDEPTSGLDSQSAFNIVRFLRKLAAAGQAILCTIHQPNSALFENFDRLLLLQKGGETVYFGEIGKDAHILLDYFRRHGAICPPTANPAEWILDAVGAGLAPRIGDEDWGVVWRKSAELAEVKSSIAQMKDARIRQVGEEETVEEKEYATPLWHQIKVVTRRANLSFWRSPNYGFTRLFNHVIVALLTGLAFLQLDDSRASLQYRIFVIFQVTILPALILAQVEPRYDLSRLIFYRESAAKAYSQFPFALSMVIGEIPYSLLCAVAFFLPLYYIPGFQSSSSRAGYQFFMILITEFFSVTLGQMISAITPSSFIAQLLNPPIMIIFALFCGVTIPKPQIPRFWRVWLYELNPFTRLVGGMVVTELFERKVVCSPGELNTFSSPLGQTCEEYMSDFFQMGGPGYLVEGNTTSCSYCAYAQGQQFYEPIGYDFANRWRDLGIFTAFVGSNLIFLFLGSRYLNFNRR